MKSGLIAINLAAVIFGSAALFGKLDVSPFWIVAMRGIFAVLTLLLVGFIRGGLVRPKSSEQIQSLIITGVLLAAHWLTFFASVQMAGIAIATLTFAAFPLFTVLLNSMIARRIPNWLEVGAGIVIVIAVGLLVDTNVPVSKLLGGLSGILSALIFALFGIKAKKLTELLPPLSVSLFQNLTVFLVLLPLLPFSTPIPTQPADWMWLIALGVVTTALMHQLYLFALSRLSATTCSGFIALEPVYAVAFSALIFKEEITLLVVLSGVLILGASLVLLKSESAANAAH